MEGEMMEDMGRERTSQVRTSSCSPGSSPLGLVVTTGNLRPLLFNKPKTSLSLVNNLNSAPPLLATGVAAVVGFWWTGRDKNSYSDPASGGSKEIMRLEVMSSWFWINIKKRTWDEQWTTYDLMTFDSHDFLWYPKIVRSYLFPKIFISLSGPYISSWSGPNKSCWHSGQCCNKY